MPSKKNYYEFAKEQLLSRPLVAGAVLLVVVLSGLAATLQALQTLIHALRSDVTLVVVPANPVVFAQVHQAVVVDFEIGFAGSEPLVVGDARLLLTPRGSTGQIPPDQVARDFTLSQNGFPLPALTTSQAIRTVSIPLTAHVAGKYKVAVEARSDAADLSARTEVTLIVDSLPFSQLRLLAPPDSPVFIARDGIADAAPGRFTDLADFKIVLVEEAYRSNLLKAAVWFSPDYIGALGGSVCRVSRDQSTDYDLMFERPESSDSEIEEDSSSLPLLYERLLLRRADNSRLEDIGFVGGVVPIGAHFFHVDLLDAQRIVFREATVPCRRITVTDERTRTPRSAIDLSIAVEDFYQGSGLGHSWKVRGLPKSVTAINNCGATGRNCVVTLQYAGHEYSHYYVAEDQESLQSTDFPVFIREGDGRYIRFSLKGVELSEIGPDYDGVVVVEQCDTLHAAP